jgi:hypothetical protein
VPVTALSCSVGACSQGRVSLSGLKLGRLPLFAIYHMMHSTLRVCACMSLPAESCSDNAILSYRISQVLYNYKLDHEVL